VTAVIVTVAVPVPVLVSVTVWVALLLPTVVAAKVKPDAEKVSAGVPGDVVPTLEPDPPQPMSVAKRGSSKTDRGRTSERK